MNKFISKIFKGAGVNAKVSKDPKNPRFRVVENKLTLEGIVRPNRYTMTIKDNTGKQIDSLSVVINNSNDIVNRINESIQTLQMISKVYDKGKLVEEDEEFDTVTADEEVVEEETPGDIISGLSDVYEDVLDIAEKVQDLTELVDDTDAESINNIIGIASSLYDCAIDIEDFKFDLEPEEEEDEDVSESLKRKTKDNSIKSVISNLTMSESLLRGNKEMCDILKAIKDIKSELIVRGY